MKVLIVYQLFCVFSFLFLTDVMKKIFLNQGSPPSTFDILTKLQSYHQLRWLEISKITGGCFQLLGEDRGKFKLSLA